MKTLMINGTDYSAFFSSEGYKVQYTEVKGKNEGLLLNGSYEKDVIAVKAVVTVPLVPMTEEQVSNLLQNVFSATYASVYYFDLRMNAYRSAVMMYETGEIQYCGRGANNNEYWKGPALVFTDKFNMGN